ncbi:MFS transporter [Gehongia tenuis]|uniref:MFS transporter n=1 Tax=Gehongia tenuis TaxID=2763655 RepID=A0A926HJZ7_9FIRM|nr:MFS transporter [Gehongia tenuis]MBC8530417.1 MFS transporter [Gehongia tenuis]
MKGLVPALFHRMHEAVLGPMEPGMDPRRVKSHSHFILEASVGQITYTLTTGVFMTGFALYLGASDNLTGIIASIPMLMNVLQVAAALLMERVKHKKRVINLLNLAYRSIMSLAIFIPLLLPERWWVPAFVAMNVLGFLFCSVLSPSFNDWMMGLTLPRVRGRFFARREASFQAAGMAASLIMGVVVDVFHKTYAAFLIPYLVAFACGILDYVFISGIEEPAETKRPDSPKRSMKERLMRNVQLFEFAGIWVLWYFGYWMAFAYFSVFMVSTLGLSYSFMTVQNTVQVLSLVLTIGLWGRYASRRGWPKCLLFTCVMVILGFFTRGFVTRELYLLLLPIGVITGVGFAGMNIAATNMVALLCDPEDRSLCFGMHAALGGLAGFLGSLAGGALNEGLAAVSIGPFSGIHLTFFIAGIVMAGSMAVFALWSRRIAPREIE